MLTRELKVGDYIINGNGVIKRITAINKETYSISSIDGNRGYYLYNEPVYKNGLTRGNKSEEWFECDDVQKAIATKLRETIKKQAKEMKTLKEQLEEAFNKIVDIFEELGVDTYREEEE